MRKTTFFVNGMLRQAKAGADPLAWLVAQQLGNDFVARCIVLYNQRLANRAQRAAKAATHAHCQICGRMIQANTGVIAHHGYKRPGEGWQTKSCFGARYVPYEQGHDALDKHIPALRNTLAIYRERYADLLVSPPATLTEDVSKGFGRARALGLVHHELPTDGTFNPHATTAIPHTYQAVFNQRRSTLAGHIRGLEQEIPRAQARLDAWRPQPK